jgi:hypothetical protein
MQKQLKLQLSLPFIDQSDLSPWGKSAVVTVVVVELQYVAHIKSAVWSGTS